MTQWILETYGICLHKIKSKCDIFPPLLFTFSPDKKTECKIMKYCKL